MIGGVVSMYWHECVWVFAVSVITGGVGGQEQHGGAA